MDMLYIILGVLVVVLWICAAHLRSIAEATGAARGFPEVATHGFWWGLTEGLVICAALGGIYFFVFR